MFLLDTHCDTMLYYIRIIAVIYIIYYIIIKIPTGVRVYAPSEINRIINLF